MEKEIKSTIKKCKKHIFNSNNLKNEIDGYFLEMEEQIIKIIKFKKGDVFVEVLQKLCDGRTPDIDFREKVVKFLDLLKYFGVEGNTTRADDFLAKL